MKSFFEYLTSRLSGRWSHKDEHNFLRRLAFLVAGNLSAIESCTILKVSLQNTAAVHRLEGALQDFRAGMQLSHALHKCGLIRPFSRDILDIGESSGTLSESLELLCGFLERQGVVSKKIKSALIYPVIIGCATMGITSLLILYVFPKIIPVFKGLNVTLPLTTRIMIALIDALKSYWWLILALVIGAVFVIRWMVKMQRVRQNIDKAALRLPFVGNALRTIELMNAARSLGTLIKNSVTIDDALGRVSFLNNEYKNVSARLALDVSSGKSLSSSLSNHVKLYPPLFCSMVSIGEASGNLGETLLYLAALYEAELDQMIKTFTTLIEPALMVTMGAIVGFVAISIISPMYAITQNLH